MPIMMRRWSILSLLATMFLFHLALVAGWTASVKTLLAVPRGNDTVPKRPIFSFPERRDCDFGRHSMLRDPSMVARRMAPIGTGDDSGKDYHNRSEDDHNGSNNSSGTNRNHASDSHNQNDQNTASAFDVEAARRKLELLLTNDADATSERKDPRSMSSTTATTTSPHTTTALSSSSSFDDDHVRNFSRKPKPRSPMWAALTEDARVQLPPPPPLTTMERERRWTEMQLLARLEEGDAVLSELWTHWFRERGALAAADLLQAETLTTQGPLYWDQAEALLQSMIEDHGIFWAEPVNRLATLYYLQGKLAEAEILCQLVLAIKPWHFGALSGIVMVYAAKHQADQARTWASRRLPTYHALSQQSHFIQEGSSSSSLPAPAPAAANRRRLSWVQKALRDAHDRLQQAEAALQQSLGAPDDHVAPRRREQHQQQRRGPQQLRQPSFKGSIILERIDDADGDDDEDAWQ